MNSDPDLVRYACVAYNPIIHNGSSSSSDSTILAEFNSADSALQELAHQCVNKAPPHHSIFSHSYRNQSYTFMMDHNPFVYFGIFDSNMPKNDQVRFLGLLKEALNHLIKSTSNNNKFTSYCFQGELHPIFHNLMSKSLDFDALNWFPNGAHNSNMNTPISPPLSGSSKGGRKVLSVPLLSSSKVGKGYKKKRFGGDSLTESKEALVENKVDMLDDGVSEVKSREINCQNGVCLMDGGGGGGRQKARKIWRRHVWIVLVLDLAVCLILFGIWLFVCRGFQCIEG